MHNIFQDGDIRDFTMPAEVWEIFSDIVFAAEWTDFGETPRDGIVEIRDLVRGERTLVGGNIGESISWIREMSFLNKLPCLSLIETYCHVWGNTSICRCWRSHANLYSSID